jgi:hypothetical protein
VHAFVANAVSPTRWVVSIPSTAAVPDPADAFEAGADRRCVDDAVNARTVEIPLNNSSLLFSNITN